MTYLQAALQILRSSKTPLSTRELLDRIVSEELIVPKGRTPLATLSAVLYTNVAGGGELRKLSSPGKTRAATGSVRWTVTRPSKR